MIRDEMLLPAVKTLKSQTLTSLGSSTTVNFESITEYIEISAVTQAVHCHIGAAATTSTDGWDFVVLPGQTKVFRVTEAMRKDDRYIALIENAAGATAFVAQFARN